MKTESKHTPGPWRVGDAGMTVFGPKQPDGSLPKRIAEVGNPRAILTSDNTKANARLIAAAPELLEALRECITDDNANGMQPGLGPQVRRLKAINEIARAAIAKAEGSL